ncbi:hypothetical protein GW17_00000566 [Ensete ventricosum]|nr:hypothetical protein GW17_00000566 [Ensete ventricosum]
MEPIPSPRGKFWVIDKRKPIRKVVCCEWYDLGVVKLGGRAGFSLPLDHLLATSSDGTRFQTKSCNWRDPRPQLWAPDIPVRSSTTRVRFKVVGEKKIVLDLAK